MRKVTWKQLIAEDRTIGKYMPIHLLIIFISSHLTYWKFWREFTKERRQLYQASMTGLSIRDR
jgi:hypothetical protein